MNETHLRDLSARQFAKLIGTDGPRARQILRSGQVKTVYETPGGQLRVAEWAIRVWQEERGIK